LIDFISDGGFDCSTSLNAVWMQPNNIGSC